MLMQTTYHTDVGPVAKRAKQATAKVNEWDEVLKGAAAIESCRCQ